MHSFVYITSNIKADYEGKVLFCYLLYNMFYKLSEKINEVISYPNIGKKIINEFSRIVHHFRDTCVKILDTYHVSRKSGKCFS